MSAPVVSPFDLPIRLADHPGLAGGFVRTSGAVLVSLALASCGGGGGGGGSSAVVTPETPQSNNNSSGGGSTAVVIDAIVPTAESFRFQVNSALSTDDGLQAAAGGAVFATWNPTGSERLYAAGMKINFFGQGRGCNTPANDGPVANGDDAALSDVGTRTGIDTSASGLRRWSPSGAFSACAADSQGLSGPNMVVLNPSTATGGGVGLYTGTGVSTGNASLLQPYTSAGQNGNGTNANINGTFVQFRQDWRSAPRRPWVGSPIPTVADARVVASQTVRAINVGTEVISGSPVQAKQQITVNFVNASCVDGGVTSARPCQLHYLFNTAIQRAGIDDWSSVAWFQNGKVWFDAAQGGIPVIEGPAKAAGTTITDDSTGLGLFVSRGNTAQFQAFSNLDFDLRISFDQLLNALRIVVARQNGSTPSAVSDAQMASTWGSRWNDRTAWALMSVAQAQEVHNPIAGRQASIGGSFSQLYVGPQN